MVYIWKKADDVCFQIKPVAAEIGLCAIDCTMGALSSATCVAIEDKAWFEDGLEELHKRMVHYAVAKRSGANLTGLGVGDEEMPVSTGAIRALDAFAANLRKMRLPVEIKSNSRWLIAFATTAALVSPQEIFP